MFHCADFSYVFRHLIFVKTLGKKVHKGAVNVSENGSCVSRPNQKAYRVLDNYIN